MRGNVAAPSWRLVVPELRGSHQLSGSPGLRAEARRGLSREDSLSVRRYLTLSSMPLEPNNHAVCTKVPAGSRVSLDVAVPIRCTPLPVPVKISRLPRHMGRPTRTLYTIAMCTWHLSQNPPGGDAGRHSTSCAGSSTVITRISRSYGPLHLKRQLLRALRT